MSSRPHRRLSAFCGLAAAAYLAGYGCFSREADPGTRAVVIGIDGADWKIVDALVAEGQMPHLSGLLDRGVRGPMATLRDVPLSPVIWTSVATGKSAAKHGVAWFLVDQPDAGRVPVRSYNRKTKAIWNILAERDRVPIAVGWWATYPAEDVGQGIVVSDALGFHGFGRTARRGEDAGKTHPEALFEKVRPLVPAGEDVLFDFARRFLRLEAAEYEAERFDPLRSPDWDPSNPIHLFQQYAVTAEGYTAIAEELLASREFDLLMVYYEQIDSFSHLFMKFAPPRRDWIADEEFARYRDVVTEWYCYQDELLGRLLAKIDLEETAVFILSDHGFKSGDRRIRSERAVDIRKAHLDHEAHGIFLAAGPQIRRGGHVQDASVLDLTPTLLHYLGLSAARDMDGRVLEEIFDPGFLETNPVRFVATYEDEPGEEQRAAKEEYDPEEPARIERALKALGYLGDSSSGESEDGGAAEETSTEIHNNLGRVHLWEGRPEEALREFSRALALDPRNAEALLNVGTLKRLQGLTAEAEHYVERALRVNPNSVAALCQLAEIKRDLNRLDESIRLYREAMSIEDPQPLVLLGLGDSLQRAGHYPEAERAFRGVLELAPDSFEAVYNLGVTFLSQGRLEEAIERFEHALEMNPRHPNTAWALNNLGDIHLRRNEVERAGERFRQAVAASPRHLESRYNLATLYLTSDRLDEAVALLEEAARLEPNHELVSAALGMAYLRQGRAEDAYRSLLLVRRLYPGNWIAPLGLALLHASSGDNEQARALLSDALRLGGERARGEASAYPALRELLKETDAG